MLANKYFLRLSTLIVGLTCLGISFAKAIQDNKASKPKQKVSVDLPPYTGPKKRLAVLDIEIKVSPPGSVGTSTDSGVDAPILTDFGTGMTEMLTTALVDSKRFVVLERKALTDVTTEQNTNNGAGFDPTTSAKSGRLLGAQVVIHGVVTEYSFH